MSRRLHEVTHLNPFQFQDPLNQRNIIRDYIEQIKAELHRQRATCGDVLLS